VCRDYFFGDLDPSRQVIQQDVDLPLTTDPGDVVTVATRKTIQIPDAVRDSCTDIRA
jgi:hypothetical protein